MVAADRPCCRCNERPRIAGYSYCRECRNAYMREWHARRDPAERAAKERLLKYGLTKADVDVLYAAHDSCCAICNVHEDDASRGGLHIDHDHASGAVRGLLCVQCNTAIGLMADDSARLRVAADYLDC